MRLTVRGAFWVACMANRLRGSVHLTAFDELIEQLFRHERQPQIAAAWKATYAADAASATSAGTDRFAGTPKRTW